MRIWTYLRPFSHCEADYTVEVSLTFTQTVSRLFLGTELLDEQSVHHMDGIQTFVHVLPGGEGELARVEVGYISWWSMGVAVIESEQTLYESHPGKNVRFAEGLMQGVTASSGAAEVAAQSQTGIDVSQMIAVSYTHLTLPTKA